MGWLSCLRCDSRKEKVIELDYSRCGIIDIPTEVHQHSPTLEILHLEGNKLKDLCPQLFQCEDLKYLNVSDNEIRAIPPLISKLANLQILIFSKNALTLDSLSPNIDKLTKLTTLDLSMNDLGKVPEAILSLINLQQLCLNDTGIEYVPANIGRLCNLRILELRDNNLSELPKSFRRLANLQRLDVSDNNLSLLSEVCESHANLTELWINGNSITKLPSSVAHLKKLNDFDASYNELETLPKEIGQWTKITNLILSFNSIVTLPKAIGNLRNLQVLKLESNLLETLPDTICKLTNLEELNLQNNLLTELPPAIGHLRKLATLILSDNKLRFLPPDIGSCSALTILNIHNNELQRLPEEIGHLMKLTTLGLIGNQLTCLPITISKLTNLKALWLTTNQTQPLLHLQNELFPDGQIVLTSVVFPQTPLPDPFHSIQPPIQVNHQNCHITFNMENTPSHASLSRTPTPHYKELRRLKNIIRDTNKNDSHLANVSSIKEARVTHIAGDMNNSQPNQPERENVNNFDRGIAEIIPVRTSMRNEDFKPVQNNLPKQPPPYHIAAVYSKNAHLFTNSGPPSPNHQPKRFSQEQPPNILMPTPKLAKPDNHFENYLSPEDVDLRVHKYVAQQYLNACSESNNMNNEEEIEFQNMNEIEMGMDHYPDLPQCKWPFGFHEICKVMDYELKAPRQNYDFTVQWRESGIYVRDVHPQGTAAGKLQPGDKVLRFDDIDFSCMDSIAAYEIAREQLLTVRIVTVSRRQKCAK